VTILALKITKSSKKKLLPSPKKRKRIMVHTNKKPRIKKSIDFRQNEKSPQGTLKVLAPKPHTTPTSHSYYSKSPPFYKL